MVLLKPYGELDGIARVHLDCLARGGRSVLDAIAIELLYPEEVRVRGLYEARTVRKVLEDMRGMELVRST